jgi:hypothetical protein
LHTRSIEQPFGVPERRIHAMRCHAVVAVAIGAALAGAPRAQEPSAVTRVTEPKQVGAVTNHGVVMDCRQESIPVPVPEPTLGTGSPADAFQFGYTSYTEMKITARGIKMPVGVAKGAVVTVSVPRRDRRTTSLRYGLHGDPPQPNDPASTVTFEACPDHETYFVGALVLTKARCVRLDVQLGGVRQRYFAPVGVKRCSGRTTPGTR